MYGKAVCAFAVLTMAAAGSPPEQEARLAWTWAKVKQDAAVQQSTGSVAWTWAKVKQESASCNCQGGCPCCDGECNCTNKQCEKLSQKERYHRLHDRAVKQNKPLLVGVKCDPPKIDGFLWCRWDGFPGQSSPAVIVGIADKGQLVQQATLSCTAPESEYRQKAMPSQPMAIVGPY